MPLPRRSLGAASKLSPRTQPETRSPPPSHHHQTADELALQEAEEILDSDDEDPNSPGARRYAELTRKREHSPEPGLTSSSVRAARGLSGDDHSGAGSVNSGSSGSGSDDSSDVSSDTDSDASESEASSATSDCDSDDEGDDELERHLIAARKAAAAREARANGKTVDVTAEDDGELRFDEEVKEA